MLLRELDQLLHFLANRLAVFGSEGLCIARNRFLDLTALAMRASQLPVDPLKDPRVRGRLRRLDARSDFHVEVPLMSALTEHLGACPKRTEECDERDGHCRH